MNQMTQKEFSELSGIPDRTLRYWKQKGEPKKNPVIQILRQLVSEGDLYNETGKVIKDENYFLSLFSDTTAYKLSKKTGVSERTIDLWKNGKDKPNTIYLRYLYFKYGNTDEFKNAVSKVGLK